ncbi:thiol-disulfide oxidoreductase [Iodidimonas gelatinilytica]|uniref:Thiol-disulfide oxidoreductase n=1 Tax=Iodidimonas gelatinilytica TaxID=1236966 RepID=A0A5A7MV57_9PROT|nr:DsbA family protein [Iodidimonas gelatinilytica]GEQ99882.1 thiol-disulfide oxidoreductase [Iodidimonas gelatinilytica]
MTHKLKQLATPSLIAFLALGLAACGNDDSSGTMDKSSAPAESASAESATDYSKVITTETASEKGFALGGVSMGNPDAPVTIIEYASLTCSHCAAFDRDVLPDLKETYIKTGKVRYEFHNYVMNRYDLAASAVARCMGPDRFFPIAELFFSTQATWLANASQQDAKVVIDDMANVVRKAGVSRTRFDQCLSERDLQQHLVEMTSEGQKRWQIAGTPTIIINGKKRGAEAQRFDTLSEIIEDEL